MKGLLILSLILQLLFAGAGKMKAYLKVLMILWLSQHLFSVDINSSTEVFGLQAAFNETTLPVTAENGSRAYQDDISNFTVDNVNETITIGTSKEYSASTENTELHFTDNLKSENSSTSKDFESPKDNVDNKTKEFSVDVTTNVTSSGWIHNHSQLIYEQDSVNGSSGIKYELNFSFNLANNSVTTVKSSEPPNINSNNHNEVNSDLFFSRRQDKSASVDNQQQDTNVISNSATTSSSPLNTNYELPDLSIHSITSIDTTISISENETSSNPDLTLYSEIVNETVSTTPAIQKNVHKVSPEPTETNTIYVINKEDFMETQFCTKVCSNYSVITDLLELFNVQPNEERMENLTDENPKDLKIDVNSKVIFNKINEVLKTVAEADGVVFIKVYPNATVDLDAHPQSHDELCLSMLTVYIICGSVLLIIVIIACVTLYIKLGRKHTTSLNLSSMSHLHMTDYNFGPIPRPSVSFSESNKGPLHAYASDNYNLPRHTNTLNKRNGSGALPKIYDEVGFRQEMQTFTMPSGRQSDFKPSASQEYVSAHSWDSLQENNYPKKFGVDNPMFRRW